MTTQISNWSIGQKEGLQYKGRDKIKLNFYQFALSSSLTCHSIWNCFNTLLTILPLSCIKATAMAALTLTTRPMVALRIFGPISTLSMTRPFLWLGSSRSQGQTSTLWREPWQLRSLLTTTTRSSLTALTPNLWPWRGWVLYKRKLALLKLTPHDPSYWWWVDASIPLWCKMFYLNFSPTSKSSWAEEIVPTARRPMTTMIFPKVWRNNYYNSG